MPAESEDQRVAACVALSAKMGKTSPSKLKGASMSMYKSMSLKDLSEFCRSKVKE